MPLHMSENINETTRHLKFRYISTLTNLLQSPGDDYMKCHRIKTNSRPFHTYQIKFGIIFLSLQKQSSRGVL